MNSQLSKQFCSEPGRASENVSFSLLHRFARARNSISLDTAQARILFRPLIILDIGIQHLDGSVIRSYTQVPSMYRYVWAVGETARIGGRLILNCGLSSDKGTWVKFVEDSSHVDKAQRQLRLESDIVPPISQQKKSYTPQAEQSNPWLLQPRMARRICLWEERRRCNFSLKPTCVAVQPQLILPFEPPRNEPSAVIKAHLILPQAGG